MLHVFVSSSFGWTWVYSDMAAIPLTCEENAAGEMGSVSNTVCERVYHRLASAEMCEHRRCMAGWAYIYLEMPCTNVGTCACWGYPVHLRE